MKSNTEMVAAIAEAGGRLVDAGIDGLAAIVPAREGEAMLCIIASWGGGWDHASIHATDKSGTDSTPTWDEMAAVKRMLWRDDETAMELHPCEDDYVNFHEHTLHIWKPQSKKHRIPTPPTIFVGPKATPETTS